MLFQFIFSLLERWRKYFVTIENILCTIYERGILYLVVVNVLFGVFSK